MKTSTPVCIALLVLPLLLMPLGAQPASSQTVPVSLNCPIFGGTCEAFPQVDGFIYAFQAQGNAFVSIPTPATSPVTRISCLRLLPSTGLVSVTVIAPDGQRGTASAAVCPGGSDDGGPFFPF